jgi:hypothetical protein
VRRACGSALAHGAPTDRANRQYVLPGNTRDAAPRFTRGRIRPRSLARPPVLSAGFLPALPVRAPLPPLRFPRTPAPHPGPAPVGPAALGVGWHRLGAGAARPSPDAVADAGATGAASASRPAIPAGSTAAGGRGRGAAFSFPAAVPAGSTAAGGRSRGAAFPSPPAFPPRYPRHAAAPRRPGRGCLGSQWGSEGSNRH